MELTAPKSYARYHLTAVIALIFLICEGVLFSAGAAENCAKIDDVEYETLDDAFLAASENQEIILINPATLSNQIRITKNITLDLQGYSITSGYKSRLFEISSGKTFTLKDSKNKGKLIGNGAVSQNGAGVLVSGGTFEMLGGCIENCTADAKKSGGGVQITENGVFNMSGGCIYNCSAKSGGGVNINSGSFNMKGGRICNCSAEQNGGGIMINSETSASLSGSSEIAFCRAHSGGGVCFYGNNLLIFESPRIIENRNDASNPDNLYLAASRIITLHSAFNGKIGITSGFPAPGDGVKFGNAASDARGAENFFADLGGWMGEFDNPENPAILQWTKYAVARIGSVSYETVEEAFAFANSGDTIDLIQSAVLSDEAEVSKSVTLNLGNKTLSAATGKRMFHVTEGAVFTLCADNGGLLGSGTSEINGRAVNVYSGTFHMTSGTISGFNSAQSGSAVSVSPAGKFCISGSGFVDGVSVVFLGAGAKITVDAGGDFSGGVLNISLESPFGDWVGECVVENGGGYLSQFVLSKNITESAEKYYLLMPAGNDLYFTTGSVVGLYANNGSDFCQELLAFGGYSGFNGSVIIPAGRAGYHLSGWDGEAAGGVSVLDGEGRMVCGDGRYTDGEGKWANQSKEVRLFGNWSANEYRVGFCNTSGAGVMGEQRMRYGVEERLYPETFTAPSGKVFAGWNKTSATGCIVDFEDGALVINLTDIQDGKVMLYAVWTDAAPTPTPTPIPTRAPSLIPTGYSGVSSHSTSGTYTSYPRTADGSATPITFGTSKTVKSVTLPQGVKGDVILLANSDAAPPQDVKTYLVFELNIPGYPTGKEAVIEFVIPLAVLENEGLKPENAGLMHNDGENWNLLPTTWQISGNTVVYHSTTDSFSPFAIVYADKASTTETPKTKAAAVPAYDTKKEEVKILPTVVKTATPASMPSAAATTTQTAASPVTPGGLLAGLGAALAFAMRRRE